MAQQNTIDPEFYIEALKEAAEGCSDEAVIEAAKDCRTGRAPEVTNGFCPSPDKFGAYVRTVHMRKAAVQAQKARLALPAPTNFRSATLTDAFAKQRQGCLSEGRELIATGTALDTFKSQCSGLTYPVGSVWINTGEVYGPKPVQQQAAA